VIVYPCWSSDTHAENEWLIGSPPLCAVSELEQPRTRQRPARSGFSNSSGTVVSILTGAGQIAALRRHGFAISRRELPEVCQLFALPSEQRAQGIPGARCTRGLACKGRRETHTSIQVQRRQSGIPCAMVLRLITRSPRRSGFFVTVAGGVLTADLTPASRRQDHTTLPSALATPVKRAVASTAPRSAFVTLRNAPLCGAGCKSYSVILVSEKQKYFFKRGWTGGERGAQVICPSGAV
jgi:hypothetical protein